MNCRLRKGEHIRQLKQAAFLSTLASDCCVCVRLCNLKPIRFSKIFASLHERYDKNPPKRVTQFLGDASMLTKRSLSQLNNNINIVKRRWLSFSSIVFDERLFN